MQRSRQLWLQTKITVWAFCLWWKKLLVEQSFTSATNLQKAYRRLQESQMRDETLREYFLGDVPYFVLDTEWFRMWPHALACTSAVVLITVVITLMGIHVFAG